MKNSGNDQFLAKARGEATKSSCLSRHVGAAIVTDNKIVAWGFNETSQGLKCGDGGCERCKLRALGHIRAGEDRKSCHCIHAEINALKNLIVRQDSRSRLSLEMYVTIPPCEDCARAIAQAGVSKVFYTKPTHDGDGILYLREQKILAEGL